MVSRCSSRVRFSVSVEAPSASIDPIVLLIVPPGLPGRIAWLVVELCRSGQVHLLQRCVPSASASVAAASLDGEVLLTELVHPLQNQMTTKFAIRSKSTAKSAIVNRIDLEIFDQEQKN